jgi:hypothetical protein
MGDDKIFTNRMRKQLLDKINELCPTEHEEIFKIISNNLVDCNYTRNTNGIFFNMSIFSDLLLSKIECFVLFCLENNKELEEYDKKLKECKINNMPAQESMEQRAVEENVDTKATSNDCCPLDKTFEVWKSVISEDASAAKTLKCLYSWDKTSKKKVYTKFHAAKKKFSKKVPLDKRSYFEIPNDLEKTDLKMN